MLAAGCPAGSSQGCQAGLCCCIMHVLMHVLIARHCAESLGGEEAADLTLDCETAPQLLAVSTSTA